MISALVLPRPGAASLPLADDLQAAGIVVLGSSTRHSLVQDCIRQAPTLLVAHEPRPDDALFTALQALHDHAPLPVLLFSDDSDAGTMERALAVGVHGYELGAYAATRLRPLVQLTLLRFRREHALREQLGDVTQRFEERKLVDRAKGILMSLRGMGEDEAFKVLRGIAMQSGQRIGDVARQVMASARSATDVNRSGQLRMLSQRIVKLQALRQHKPQAEAATTQLRDAVERLDGLLAALSKDLSAASFGDLLAAQRNSWQALQAALARDAALAEVDTLAEQLLRQSDALTGALEAAGAVPTLQVVNVAGRQRMLSQRAAKLALLGQAAELAATCTQFEHAMALLHATPLSSGEIRGTLAAVDAEWLQLRRGITAVATASGCATVATASEALLAELDRLTGLYERSMQVLVG